MPLKIQKFLGYYDSMREKFSIRLISINEIPEITNWARLEGFSPGIDDVSIYRNTDKQGVWVACLDNNPIGSIACIKYIPRMVL